MKRRLMVILLSLTLIFTLIPMTAFAAEGGTREAEKIKITLKPTALGGNPEISDWVIYIDKDSTIQSYFSDHHTEYCEIVEHFTANGLVPSYRPREHRMVMDSYDMDNYSSAANLFKYSKDLTILSQDTICYVPMFIPIKEVNYNIENPVCGTSNELVSGTFYSPYVETNPPKVTINSDLYTIYLKNNIPYISWCNVKDGKPNKLSCFEGTFVGDNIYASFQCFEAKYGYVFDPEATVDAGNAEAIQGNHFSSENSDAFDLSHFSMSWIKAVHDWDEGVVTTKPTVDKEGVKTYTCKGCEKTRTESIPKLEAPVEPPAEPPVEPGSDPTQMGSDGTAVGEGASAAAADQKITSMKTDKDPKGSKFNKLRLRSVKQTKTSITLKWKSSSKAAKYVIYGNRCGSSTKIRKSVKLYTVKKSSKTTMTKVIKKIKGAKLKKNTYYKFLVVALNKNNKVVSTSRMIHVATKGGKYTNYKSISVKKDKITKARNLKKGKSLKLEAKQIKVTKSLKARKHVPIRYESSNKTIAKVTSKGTIKALKKGTCYVYIYAQNGVYKRIKVVVK